MAAPTGRRAKHLSKGTPPRSWLVLALPLLLAGCTTPVDDAVQSSPETAIEWPVLPCEADPTDGLSKNLEVVTFNQSTDYREELDSTTRDGKTLLAIAQPRAGSIVLYDATDPRHLVELSTFVADDAYADDIKFIPDGTAMIMAGGWYLHLVDYRWPQQPALEAVFRLDGPGAHMAATWELDNETYVSISKAEDGDVSIFRIDGAPGQRNLTRMVHFATSPGGMLPEAEPLHAHDTWFEIDPVTNTPLLWVADVYWGIFAYDVSDPTTPVEVAAIINPPPYPGYMHNVQVAHIDGRRLVVGLQEYGTGVVKVFDATDLEGPRYVGYLAPGLLTTAFHNLQIVDGYALAGHFDEGLYIIDLRAVPDGDTAEELEVFAHAPAAGERDFRIPVGLLQGNFATQDVEVRDGVIWTSEAFLGIRAFAFGCFAHGDTALTSTG